MPVNQLDAFNWFFRLALVSLFSWFVFFPFRYFVPDAINKEKQTLFYFGHFVVRAQAICFWNVSMQFISLTARRYINANNTHTHTQTISDRSVWFGLVGLHAFLRYVTVVAWDALRYEPKVAGNRTENMPRFLPICWFIVIRLWNGSTGVHSATHWESISIAISLASRKFIGAIKINGNAQFRRKLAIFLATDFRTVLSWL